MTSHKPPKKPYRNLALSVGLLLALAVLALILIVRAYERRYPGSRSALIGAAEATDWRARSAALRREDLPFPYSRLLPLARVMPEPGPSDWLASHPETGQSLRDYQRSGPVRPTAARRVLYILPIGDFTPDQQRILDHTHAYLADCFQVPVRSLDPLPLDGIPARARRQAFGAEQLLTGYLLQDVLEPRRPDDALAVIGLTATDLWPGQGWNFVFGQASLRDRVGIWSMARFGDPSASDDAFRLCLERTWTTAGHETGHILGMRHCITYQCLMNGSNNLPESDRAPLQLCPVCSAKLNWNVGSNPVTRAKALAARCRKAGLTDEAERYDHMVQALVGGTR